MKQRTIYLFLIPVLCLTVFSFKRTNDRPAGSPQPVIRTIIVDAGHGIRENGGHDGAKGSYSWEDEICLGISKKLVQEIRTRYPDIKVVETRPTEKITSLYRRADIANENRGDIFICIHVNAAPGQRHAEVTGYKTQTYYVGKGKNRKKKTKQVAQYRYWTEPSKAKGTETYIWGAHKTDDKELAVRENASMLQEEDYKNRYGALDVNSPEFVAMALLKTKQYFKRSATFAGMIQDEFVNVGRVDRDVRQRGVGIWVLQATAMPSVLIETGFITNPDEEAYLNSKDGQDEITRCIMNALKNYQDWLIKKQSDNDNEADDTEKEKDKDKDPRKGFQAGVKNFLEMVDQQEREQRKGL